MTKGGDATNDYRLQFALTHLATQPVPRQRQDDLAVHGRRHQPVAPLRIGQLAPQPYPKSK